MLRYYKLTHQMLIYYYSYWWHRRLAEGAIHYTLYINTLTHQMLMDYLIKDFALFAPYQTLIILYPVDYPVYYTVYYPV